MVTVRQVIQNEVGLHARPAAVFVRCANKFRSAITVRNTNSERPAVNAKSILQVLGLGVSQGNGIEIRIEGDDEENAAAALTQLILSDFAATPEPG